MAEIVLEDVTKVFADGTKAVDGIDLQIPDGRLMVLVGPSGCGKTTILRMVAGLEDITDGAIWIGDRFVNDLSPGERDLAMVFQNYALYPHMTVYQNMALSLKIRKINRKEMDDRVRQAASILHLEELLAKRPRELSGGQRQRVAMGRAIVREPQAFLMDEPLSNLDAKLRVQMRAEILRIQQELQVTTIYVTHDQTEAMTLGDSVAVLNRGLLQQVAPPQELYRQPRNLFVAGFIGSPAMNMVDARLKIREGGLFVEFGSNRLRVPESMRAERPGLDRFVDRGVVLGIRPEDLEDSSVGNGAPPEGRLPAVVEMREDMGAEVYFHFTVDAPPVLTEDTKDLASDRGEEVLEELQDRVAMGKSPFIARVSPESTVRVAEKTELAVDTRKLYFFDPASGEAISNDTGAAAVGATGSHRVGREDEKRRGTDLVL
jgi:multiple sugar transport system ATP-binding protein